jgi:hypothetical protein
MGKDTKELHDAIQSLYDTPLSALEMAEAERNLTGFFKLLITIDQRTKRGKHESHQG